MTTRRRSDRPFEKHDELDRYDNATPALLEDWKRRDPLRFAADHIPSHDRRRLSAIMLMVDRDCGFGVVNIIESPPTNPGPDDCYAAVAGFADAAAQHDMQLGLILHRHGPERQTVVDERWHSALLAAAAKNHVPVLGTVVRTVGGELVRVRA